MADVAYGADARQRLDIYAPPGVRNRPSRSSSMAADTTVNPHRNTEGLSAALQAARVPVTLRAAP
ncbi:hypothetical protein [Achromobacter sp. ESBL13]|uniref:hypothetical protein n=1 Tax=Achromobacter sp. ESBL13 TaxID=3077328 RepID=UPI002FC825D8